MPMTNDAGPKTILALWLDYIRHRIPPDTPASRLEGGKELFFAGAAAVFVAVGNSSSGDLWDDVEATKRIEDEIRGYFRWRTEQRASVN